MGWVAVEAYIDGPEHEVRGWDWLARFRVVQVEAFLAYADCAGGRLQAERFFDHSSRVFELVEEVSIGFQLRGGLRWVRAKDFIVLGADAGEAFGGPAVQGQPLQARQRLTH